MVKNPRALMLVAVALVIPPTAFAQTLPEPGAQVEHALWTVAADGSADPTSEAGVLHNYYQRVSHDHFAHPPESPPDPNGYERLQQPTPSLGHGFGTEPTLNRNTRTDPATLGIRLDTSYGLVREIYTGTYFSEHQFVAAGGATVLPYQSPCFILGTRVLYDYIDNQSMVTDYDGLSLDIFGGTRYKTVYLKGGAIWDYQEDFGKVGLSFGALTKFPIAGYGTLDTAFAWRTSGDKFDGEFDPVFNLRSRRIEAAEFDMQIRIGRFMTPWLQMGGTGNYLRFNHTFDEWGGGAFANLYLGRFILGGDVTGGNEGLRGFVTLSVGWGKSVSEHPYDTRLPDIDTVGWVTRPPERDLQVRLRQTFTGPLRAQAP